MKDWMKAVGTIVGIFLSLMLFHLFWPSKMDLGTNTNFVSAVRDENQNILAVFGEKTTLYNTSNKIEKDKLNKYPIVPIISYKELPENYIYFLTKVENKNFFDFGKDNVYGMSVSGVARLLKGKADGGSNISQQLLKNVIHKKDGTGTLYLSRKYGEQLAAFQMYKSASSEEILIAYTNYAGNFWYEQDFSGLILASYAIFSRPPNQLNDLEMLLTVKTLKSGTELKTLCKDRVANKEIIKEKMLRYFELISDGSEEEKNRLMAMKQMELQFSKENKLRSTTALTNFLKYQAQQYEPERALQYVSAIEKKKQDQLKVASDQFKKRFRSSLKKKGYVLEYAVLAIDIKTGQIEASLGNKENNGAILNFTDYGNGFQCGSVLKPLVFLELFENHNFSASSELYNGDLKQYKYNPSNVNEKLLNKTVSVKDVFKYSLNKAAVNHRTKTNPVKVAKSLEKKLSTMNISSNPDYYISESYILGTRNMTPLNLAQAYQMIFNEGNMRGLTAWKYIIDPHTKDTVFNSYLSKKKSIYKKEHTERIKKILPAAFEPGGTCHRLLPFLPKNRRFYGKTGTTGNAVDGWTVLSDGDKLIVAWVGYLKNEGGILTQKGAPSVPTKSGGGSAGVLAAMSYAQLYE